LLGANSSCLLSGSGGPSSTKLGRRHFKLARRQLKLPLLRRRRPVANGSWLGVGLGLSFAALANLIVVAVRQDQTGIATGMNTVMRTIGGAVGAQLAGTLLAGGVVAATGLPSEGAYTAGFLMCGGALVVAVVVSFGIPTRARVRAAAPVAAD
jgi:hypothetical protein